MKFFFFDRCIFSHYIHRVSNSNDKDKTTFKFVFFLLFILQLLHCSLATPSTSSFIPEKCNGSTHIGPNCSISSSPCDMLQPCQNDGTCNNTDDGYHCSCPPDFSGIRCESDRRLCKTHTCSNHGIHISFLHILLEQ